MPKTIRNSSSWRIGLPSAAVGACSLVFAQVAAAAPPPPTPAPADSSTYQTQLSPVNRTTGSGTISIALTGRSAVISEAVDNLADKLNGKPYPHLQHMHINGRGECPVAQGAANGIVTEADGTDSYGPIGTTLSIKGDTSPAAGADVDTAPHGQQFTYSRTIDLDADSLSALKSGKAVIVVDGLDPSDVSGTIRAEKSEVAPALPLVATAPALCGVLKAAPTESDLPRAPALPGTSPGLPVPGVPRS
jgi:hypothetical protein